MKDIKALRETNLSQRSSRPPAPVGASSLRWKSSEMTTWTWCDGQEAERSDSSGMSGEFTLPIAFLLANMSTPTSTKSFWESIWFPGSRGTQPDGIYAFWQIQHWPRPPKSLSGRWRNDGYWRIGRHIRRNLIRWNYLSHTFCSQKVRLHLMLIWQPYIRPSPQIKTG